MWSDSNKGDGIWKERINQETGESSIKEHTLKVVKVWCLPKDHVFSDPIGGDREIVCKLCGYTAKFILGHHELKNGKLTEKTAG